MAETIKSALLLDYESLERSLADAGAGDGRLAERAPAWLSAIETGRLIGPQGTRRRIVSKRCYAGPSVLGKQRDALGRAGFEVVDCGANEGAGRNAADIHMTIDTIETLARPGAADEFILLTASSDLAPLLARLKTGKRLAAIYADAATPEGDKAFADALLDKTAFAEFLASSETPAAGDGKAAAAADRAEIEEFARRIHAATNIPLFSPKTYSDLFRHLTEEIRENGYHFQTTARNVAERLTTAGRNVTRRQVVFIVKGLALKGHVFSTSDTADGLAEVFREQARYLVTNAGMELNDRQNELLNAWFVSRAPPPAPAKAKPAPDLGGRNGSKAPPPATPAAEPPAAVAKVAPREPPAPAKPPPPAAKPAPVYVKPVDLPKTTARPASPVKAPSSPAAREEAKAVIAARIAASAKLKPSTRAPSPAKPAVKAPAPPSKTPPPRKVADPAPDELETSILAAIAEAVDVLVDDRAKEEASAAAPPKRRKPGAPPTAAEPMRADATANEAASEGDDADGGDIGDQIQRIIASYNRNRSDE